VAGQHQRPVRIYSDSLDGQFYYDPKEHALHPVSSSHQRKPFEEYYRIDPKSHEVIPLPHAYTPEENRLMWEQLHPSTPPPSRPSSLPGELDEYNRRAPYDATNPFPPARGSQHGRPPSGDEPNGGGSGQVQVVPSAVCASANSLRDQGDQIGATSGKIAPINVTNSDSVWPLGLAAFSAAASTHLHQRGEQVGITAKAVLNLAVQTQTLDGSLASEFRA
jgi:hypothetical protein